MFNCHLMFGAAISPLPVLGNSGGGALPNVGTFSGDVLAYSLLADVDCNSSSVGRSTAESVQFHSIERSWSQGEELTLSDISGNGLYQYQVL